MKFREILKKLGKIGTFPIKMVKKLGKLVELDDQDKDSMRAFFLEITLNGVFVNLIFFTIFGMTFNWYSWIAYGLMVKMIETKLIYWIRLVRWK